MKKTKKILSIFLALLMVVSIIPMSSISASAVDTNAIKQKIVNTHKSCLSKTGRTSFNGFCGLYVQTQLSVLGIGNYTAWNGKDWYGNIADGSKSNGYTVKKYSGYNALNTLINNHGSEIYNVVMCYPQQYGASASSPGYGHVMFIHAVVNGYVYFSESYSATNEPEGSAVVLSVSAFNSRYNSWYGNAQGCIWFNNNSVATTGITLSSSPFTLNVGECKTLSATVSPSNATNKTVTWSSNNTSVATVSSSGVVKAVGTGACAITAKASGGQTASVVIIVRNESPAPVANSTYKGHYYELYQDVLSWTDAKEYCESKGGHLVTITTQEENSFVQSFASNGEKEKYYIGGTDEVTEGTWKWVTSETFSYINLGTGEPSPTEYEKEDYLYISKITGQWGDIVDITGGVNSYSFICEYDDLSDIVVDQLPEGADPDDYELVTEYRSRDKSTTTSTSSTLDGWTLYDSESTYGSWGSTQTTTSKPTASDTLQIIGTSTQYNYFHYVNYYDGIYNIDSIPYGTSHGKHTITRSSALSKVSLADQGGKQAYGSQTCSCGFNYWFLEGTSTVYSYQTRTKTTTNHFYKWSDWTAWTETPITSTDTKQVETRIGYRLKDENGTDNPDTPEVPDTPNIPDTEFVFSIKQPSRTTIRNKDGIVLHSNIEGTTPTGSYVDWSWNNSKFDVEKNNDGTLTIISENNGKTTFTATLYSADGEVFATDTIEMQSKAGFFDKIGGFFRSLFGATKIYEN